MMFILGLLLGGLISAIVNVFTTIYLNFLSTRQQAVQIFNEFMNDSTTDELVQKLHRVASTFASSGQENATIEILKLINKIRPLSSKSIIERQPEFQNFIRSIPFELYGLLRYKKYLPLTWKKG